LYFASVSQNSLLCFSSSALRYCLYGVLTSELFWTGPVTYCLVRYLTSSRYLIVLVLN